MAEEMATVNEYGLQTFSGRSDLARLAAASTRPCISILLPTHRAGSQTRQDSIRFSNLLKQAEQKLDDLDLDTSILATLHEKLDDPAFWQHQGEGLAIFATNDEMHLLSLDYPVEERVVVDECFYLKPLVMNPGPSSYFLLALTWEQARLFRVTSGQWSLVENDRLPVAYDDLMLPRDPEDQLQDKSFQAVGNAPNSNTAMFHGQGGGEDKIEGDRRNYIARVADLIEKEIYNDDRPLVLVATEEVVGTFATAAHVDIADTISQSPANLSDSELEHKFKDSTSERLQTSSRERIAKFGNRFGTAMNQSLASDQIDEVVVAALRGQIDSLMVNTAANIRGVVNRSTQDVTVEDSDQSTDLVNFSVVEALRTGATVSAASADRMPGKSQMVAAIFRF